MVVDKLNKLLIAANFKTFVKITRVENKMNILALVKKEEKLKKIL